MAKIPDVKVLEEELALERKKLSSDRMDVSFGELINMYKNQELIIRPEYQRLFRWTLAQKTALIESILLSIPIPPIFVAENSDGVWELVDGLQRLSTLISFFGELSENVTHTRHYTDRKINDDEVDENEEYVEELAENYSLENRWVLEEGSLLPSLEGFDVDNLPNPIKINLKRATCRVEILRGESQTSMKYELFRRLNSGGSKLMPQEIRNAIYRGANSQINDLTLELSQNEIFMKLTDLSARKKQELYDQELVLRFIAFYDNIENVNDNTEKFLNLFMGEAAKNDGFDCDMYRNKFTKALELVDSLGDAQVFRSTGNKFVPVEFEGILVALAQNMAAYENNLALLRNKINTLKTDSEFKKFSGSGSSSKTRNKLRLQRANDIFSEL